MNCIAINAAMPLKSVKEANGKRLSVLSSQHDDIDELKIKTLTQAYGKLVNKLTDGALK